MCEEKHSRDPYLSSRGVHNEAYLCSASFATTSACCFSLDARSGGVASNAWKTKGTPMKKRGLNTSVQLACPFCGKVTSVTIDEGGGEHQTYVEDCSRCCKPRVVHIDPEPESKRGPRVWLERDDGL
jgi:hypothetical protein